MNTKVLTGVAIALAIAGCASTPKPNEALESARRIVQAAEADPNAAKYAAVDVQTAKTDLAWRTLHSSDAMSRALHSRRIWQRKMRGSRN